MAKQRRSVISSEASSSGKRRRLNENAEDRDTVSQKPSESAADGDGSKRFDSKNAQSKLDATKEKKKKVRSGGDDEEPAVSVKPAESTADRDGGKKYNSKTVQSKLDATKKKKKEVHSGGDDEEPAVRLLGDPIPSEEARKRWPNRYEPKKQEVALSKRTKHEDEDDEDRMWARYHYKQAEVDGILYNLYDDAHVEAGEGNPPHICNIVELFEAEDGIPYFTARWFYRAKDTVTDNLQSFIDDKRVFISKIMDANPLDCLVEKITVARISLNVDLQVKLATLSTCDYYCDMAYLLPYSTFINLSSDDMTSDYETSSSISTDVDMSNIDGAESQNVVGSRVTKEKKMPAMLLDLYSGCGAMSNGLCLGANLAGLNLVTKWAVDLNEFACKSLKWNHPQAEVRNESAEDFCLLLKEWQKLCACFSLIENNGIEIQQYEFLNMEDEADDESEDQDSGSDSDSEIFEVEKVVAICYGDPNEKGECGLYLKVRWKNYTSDHDTWEPIQGLSNCRESIQKFVIDGYKSKMLPLPGDVDVICGGPPCQGISGFNRFRNTESPLEDEKNKQLPVYMDIVAYLRPRYVLMENVVDILKFSNCFLGKYALSRLVQMNYQARMGLMVAGAYGLPQFRMRFFLWGASPMERLPQFPLPTHHVELKGNIPRNFKDNLVAYDEREEVDLAEKLLLKDAISDLPSIDNDECRDEMSYDKDPITEFQQFIRLRKDGSMPKKHKAKLLYDHCPLKLNNDDYQRVCQIPKKKGANFRNLPGVRVGSYNKVEWDPNVDRIYLDSGKPLVPDYAMTFVNGKSTKPFGRLWWDEIVSTVVTRAEPHNQVILHPVQNRVLSVRENARLQGFPDYYKLFGPIKERYIQVGNAVAIPVAKALGYALGRASKGLGNDDPLFKLPPNFSFSSAVSEFSSESLENNV